MRTDYIGVYKAWQRFRKGKKPSQAIDEFAYDLEANIAELAAAIQDKTYRHGGYQKVVIAEKKRRDLAVANVRDRVVHRLLYDYLLEKFDAEFDPDVWSCRVGKGLHKCLTRTQSLLKKHPGSYVWRADITKFFDNVDHARMLNCLRRKIGDDFILFCPTRRQAHQARRRAAEFLDQELGLSLNPKNDVVITVKSNLKFLGHIIAENSALVDQHTARHILRKVAWHNIASYHCSPAQKPL